MVGDRVHVRDPVSKLGKHRGVISEARTTNTESLPSSFVIDFDNGHSGIRHKSYLKHEIVKEDKEKPNSNDETVGGGRRITFRDETAAGLVTR